MALGTQDFRDELSRTLSTATSEGKRSTVVKAGELHRQLGDYPGREHRMPICCEVMYQEMKSGDEIMAAPPKGKGASLTVRYQLPRH